MLGDAALRRAMFRNGLHRGGRDHRGSGWFIGMRIPHDRQESIGGRHGDDRQRIGAQREGLHFVPAASVSHRDAGERGGFSYRSENEAGAKIRIVGSVRVLNRVENFEIAFTQRPIAARPAAINTDDYFRGVVLNSFYRWPDFLEIRGGQLKRGPVLIFDGEGNDFIDRDFASPYLRAYQ